MDRREPVNASPRVRVDQLIPFEPQPERTEALVATALPQLAASAARTTHDRDDDLGL